METIIFYWFVDGILAFGHRNQTAPSGVESAMQSVDYSLFHQLWK